STGFGVGMGNFFWIWVECPLLSVLFNEFNDGGVKHSHFSAENNLIWREKINRIRYPQSEIPSCLMQDLFRQIISFFRFLDNHIYRYIFFIMKILMSKS